MVEQNSEIVVKTAPRRHRFSAIDMLRQARGLPTPEGYAVITKEFADYLTDELERLYQVEDTAIYVYETALAEENGSLTTVYSLEHPVIQSIRQLCNLPQDDRLVVKTPGSTAKSVITKSSRGIES